MVFLHEHRFLERDIGALIDDERLIPPLPNPVPTRMRTKKAGRGNPRGTRARQFLRKSCRHRACACVLAASQDDLRGHHLCFSPEDESPCEDSEGAGSDLDRLPDDSSSDDDANGSGMSSLRAAKQAFRATDTAHAVSAQPHGQLHRSQHGQSAAPVKMASTGSHGGAAEGAVGLKSAAASHSLLPGASAPSGARRPASGAAPSSRPSAIPEDFTMRRIKAQVGHSSPWTLGPLL